MRNVWRRMQPIVATRCLHMRYSSSHVWAFCLCSQVRHRLSQIRSALQTKQSLFSILPTRPPIPGIPFGDFTLHANSLSGPRARTRNVAARFALYRKPCTCCDELTSLPELAAQMVGSLYTHGDNHAPFRRSIRPAHQTPGVARGRDRCALCSLMS